MNLNNTMKKNIKKIVYVMFENRSFDNTLGWLYNGNANPKVNSIPPNPSVSFQGLTPALQQKFAQPIEYRIARWDDGNKPIVRGVQNNHYPCQTPFIDPEETFDNITYQIYQNNDACGTSSMKGFLQNYYTHSAGYLDVELEILNTYDNNQLPILNTLASSYGVSDEWFCSIPSQTAINRSFSICGNSVGYQKKGDTKTTAMVNNHYWNDEFLPAPFCGPTVWEVLSEHGHGSAKDWKIYYSDNYLDGNLGYKNSYSYYLFPTLRPLLDKNTNYQTLDQFYTDAKNGNLPKFSYIEPKYTVEIIPGLGIKGTDYHPPGNVALGEAFLKQLYESLSESPDWDNLLFIVAWDEHGGTFDHMPPPTTAINPRDADCYEKCFKFDRFGVRVPMLFISPWVKENTVIRSGDPQHPFDHTSWLATLLDWFGIEPGLLGQRVAAAPTFDKVIDETCRKASPLPAVWGCQSSDAIEDKPLTAKKAAEVAKVMASHIVGTDEVALLHESLAKAKTEAELACFYRDWFSRLKSKL